MLKLKIPLLLQLSSKIYLVILAIILWLYLPLISAQTGSAVLFPFTESSYLIPDFEDSYGVAFRDVDQDNWPDLYIVAFRNLNRFFINLGPGAPFLDYTIQSGLGGNLMPYGRRNL